MKECKFYLQTIVPGIKGQWSVLCLLINWGANIYSKDETGNTAMDYARMFGHRESARGLALYEWHLNKEQHVIKKPSSSEEQSIDIMSQFPPHWIAEIPGCNVKQVSYFYPSSSTFLVTSLEFQLFNLLKLLTINCTFPCYCLLNVFTPTTTSLPSQIFSPPVTMNLVAARAANMLVILPEATGREDAERPVSPSYTCGKDHAIPGVAALHVKKSAGKVTLPPLVTQR